MAEVFLAEVVDERGDQQSVALKLMKRDVPEEVFANEADLMGLLTHPNLVQRLEVGHAFGRPFIAMEFLIGGDLREVMESLRQQKQPFPVGMAVHVVLEVLKGLSYFHQAKTRTGAPLNLVHGDVNPANVFFSSEGEVKLGDFGVAKSRSVDIGPADGNAAGKLHYLSPEQSRGEALAPASDLFSVGVMLYELLVGTVPFGADGDDTKKVVAAIRSAKLAVPESVDKSLAQALHRALAPELKSRYRTAGELAGDLFRFALDSGSSQSKKDVQGWLEGVLGLLV